MSRGFDWTAALGEAVAADKAALQATLALQAILAANNRSNAASRVARRDFERADRELTMNDPKATELRGSPPVGDLP